MVGRRCIFFYIPAYFLRVHQDSFVHFIILSFYFSLPIPFHYCNKKRFIKLVHPQIYCIKF